MSLVYAATRFEWPFVYGSFASMKPVNVSMDSLMIFYLKAGAL